MVAINKYRISIFKQIFTFICKKRKWFVFNCFTCIVILSINFLEPMVYQIFIDDVILDGELNRLLNVVTGYLLMNLVSFLNSYVDYRAAYIVECELTLNLKKESDLYFKFFFL